MTARRYLGGMGLALLIGVQALSLPLVVVGFYLNQPMIAATLCVNRDRPELGCEGQCHLSTQVEKAQQNDAEMGAGLSVLMPFWAACATLWQPLVRGAYLQPSAREYPAATIQRSEEVPSPPPWAEKHT